MRYVLCALTLLCGTAQAAMISGQVTGTTVAVPHKDIDAGLPFRFEFSIDTDAPKGWTGQPSPYTSSFYIFVDGIEYIRGEIPSLYALPGPSTPSQYTALGTLTEDTIVARWMLGAGEHFAAAFTVPGLFENPLPQYPLANLTLESITGVSINFLRSETTYEEWTPLVYWLAVDAPVSPVPEPSAYLLCAMALVGLVWFRRLHARPVLHRAATGGIVGGV
jgi:hypothetical protein